MKRSLYFALVLLLAAPSVWAAGPNVVFVITDDQGYGDLSCHGNPVLETPQLDTLYGESVRFTNYHVSPTCAPTRGALMSGHFTNRAGPWHTIMGRSMLYEGEKTLGEVFQDNGYATGMFGKWHLGDNYPYRPEDRGFEEVVRHGGGGVGQTPDYWDNSYFDDTYFHNGKPEQYEGYCTDVYFREAQRFIGESIRAERPFFAYISTNAPHGPFHCPDEYWKPYADKVGDQEAVFFGMIANIDENVGRMRAWLEAEGVADNTVFIFTTDNGTASGEKVWSGGMRGKKGSAYDGGHRVPFFLHWPGGGFDEGVDIDQLTAHIDVLPTFIDLLGFKPLENYKPDGVSLVPLLKAPDAAWPERTIITDSQRVRDPIKWRQSSTMTQRWRLINGEELYDMEADPAQGEDVAEKFPEVVARLRGDYDAWWADISPVFEKDSRIIIGNSAENPTLLTCHDWLPMEGGTPWNQRHIRSAERGMGEWALKVDSYAVYRIWLRRWPKSLDRPINEGLPAGAPVEGLRAMRETPGVALDVVRAGIKIGDISVEGVVDAGKAVVPFEVDLEPGEVNLFAYFELADGERVGAYYVDVEKL